MPLPELLPIQPFTRPARGEVTLPGSKSLTNRALLLAALCDAPVTLTGALFSEDTQLMVEALRKLGFTVEADERALTLRVADQAKAFPAGDKPVELFVGLAGTAARFLTALCAAAPRGVYRLDGVPQMRKRPIGPLICALRDLGAEVRCTGHEGFFPLEIRARGLNGGPVNLDARESSQLLSALLMVAPLARASIKVTLVGGVRWPFVQMTTRLMEEFGQPPMQKTGHEKFSVHNAVHYKLASPYAIEPDATAASYFQALPLVTGGRLSLPSLRPPGEGLQGDSAFVEVLAAVRTRKPGALLAKNFSEFSDTFLTLAAIAPLLEGPTRITGIAHTRKQETDRVTGMVAELRRLGQDVIEHEDKDGLTITPRLDELKKRTAHGVIAIETYGDHRFAMSFGILGCHNLHGDGRPWLTIKHPACCAKTFPNFFDELARIHAASHKDR
jgi:3-phosphoshikimate 1-carboxyvinyltransferase